MRSEKVTGKQKDYRHICRLLNTAFPKSEQYPAALLRLLAMRRSVQFRAYYDGEVFAGFTYYSFTKTTVFILYLAVNDQIRSRGYGSAILRTIAEENPGKNIVLNIEPPAEDADNAEQRKKRLQFYERNGFHDSGYEILDDIPYQILTASVFSKEEYIGAVGVLSGGMLHPKIRKCAEKEEKICR